MSLSIDAPQPRTVDALGQRLAWGGTGLTDRGPVLLNLLVMAATAVALWPGWQAELRDARDQPGRAIRLHGPIASRRDGQPMLVLRRPLRHPDGRLLLPENAVKFSRPGGGVRLRARRPADGFWCAEVADDGIGIAAADQERIFHKFTQVTSGARKAFGGSGMGLALARQLARAMGGDITVASELGAGAVFTLRLPVAAAAG